MGKGKGKGDGKGMGDMEEGREERTLLDPSLLTLIHNKLLQFPFILFREFRKVDVLLLS